MAHKKGKQLVGPYYEGREGGAQRQRRESKSWGPMTEGGSQHPLNYP